jgi:PAS domain S-box-containing protein
MVVDDEVIIATQLQEVLQAEGYDVIGMATSGEDAAVMAAERRPDLILMDIKMTGAMDGIATAEIVQTQLDIPVVFISAYADEDILERAKHLEPFGYVVKPVEKKQLKATVEIAIHKKAVERRLRESEEKYFNLVELSPDPVVIIQENRYQLVNNAFEKLLGYTHADLAAGLSLFELVAEKDREAFERLDQSLMAGGPTPRRMDVELVAKDGHLVLCEISTVMIQYHHRPAMLAIMRDMTERQLAAAALQQAHDELERRVQERTAQLQIKTKNLEEMNTALNVLLKKREKDKIQLEEKVLLNVKELILPFLDKLKNSGLNATQQTYRQIIAANIDDIVSPLVRTLSTTFLNLTPSEIQIANMVKQGLTTKEMAQVLNLSARTIESHRDNIRRKLGIKNKKANLRSHLLSLQ